MKQGNVREWLVGTTLDRVTEGLPEEVTRHLWEVNEKGPP